MPQTTVQYRQRKWLAEGQYASTGLRTVEGALQNAYNGNAGVLPFGRLSAMDSTTRQVTTLAGAPASGTLLIIPVYAERYGLSLVELNTEPNITDIGYPEGDDVLIEYMTTGEIVMYSEVAVEAGDPVFARHTANGADDVIGRVRNVDDTGNVIALPTGFKFAETTTAAGLVAVTVDGVIKV